MNHDPMHRHIWYNLRLNQMIKQLISMCPTSDKEEKEEKEERRKEQYQESKFSGPGNLLQSHRNVPL